MSHHTEATSGGDTEVLVSPTANHKGGWLVLSTGFGQDLQAQTLLARLICQLLSRFRQGCFHAEITWRVSGNRFPNLGLVFGMLYPAYYSYKAVKTKNVKEYEIDEYIVQAKERGYETMVNFGRQGLNLAATAAVTAAVKSQGAITEKLRSFSMHDLTTIQGDEPVGQPYQTLPEAKKKTRASTSESSGYKTPLEKNTGDDKTDEEMEGTHSEDEMFAQRGLRRTQSMKSVKSKGRKEASMILRDY
ncbi:hypothetical protein BTVI_88731 [Pitangus sulphuratus]|nr:hypothetical protein BTVI_88731 [Pitangus sulphuratus]